VRRVFALSTVILVVLTAPASARLIAYSSTSCDQGGGEPRPQMFGPAACADSIWVAQPDGSSPRRLTLGEQVDMAPADTNPSWSPDGTLILFERRMPSGSQVIRLWAVRPDGTDLHPLTADSASGTDTAPVFTPDGTRIAFTRIAQGGIGWAVGTVRLDGSGFTFVAEGGGVGYARSFSPDGARVLWTENDPLDFSGASEHGYSATLDGGDRQLAFDGTALPSQVSSDGRWFAWLLPSATVAVADLRAGTASVLTPQGFILGTFAPRDPSVLRVGALDSTPYTIHNYEIDLDAPRRPHRPAPAEVVPGAVEQPGPVPPDGAGLAAPVAFGFVDPYPPSVGQDFDDPWDQPARAALRAASSEAGQRHLGYSALAYSGLRSVAYSIGHRTGRGRCSYFTGRRFLIHGRCGARHWRRIASADAWEAAAARLPRGTYEVAFRAVDQRGRRSAGRMRVVRL
jgi:hypothetical protein